MTIDQIFNAILEIGNTDDLRRVADAYNIRHRELQARATRTFRAGDKISWESQRAGRRMTGVVQKVNQKTLKVLADNGQMWTVAGALAREVV